MINPRGRGRKVALPSSDTTHSHAQVLEINELLKKKEKLEMQIHLTSEKLDLWTQVLGCSSAKELGELADSLSPSSLLHPHLTPTLHRYHHLLTHHRAQNTLGLVDFYETESGQLLIKFLRPPATKPQYSARLMLLTKNEDGSYRVESHTLPGEVPVAELTQEYLAPDSSTEENEKLTRFVTHVGQYTKALYGRQRQVEVFEEAHITKQSSVYHNKACTLINFIVDLKEEEGMESHVEFVLHFDPLDLLPHKVDFNFLYGEKLSTSLLQLMQDLAMDMKTEPFPVLMMQTFKSPSEEGENSSTASSTSSSDTAIFTSPA